MIYKELQGEGIYHLSTSMYPKHRKRVLKRIRERLKNNEKCIVISTSLVEAGVDLDFATVYRQIAGLDSMIQAAGRCNREGKRELSESMVYIFDLEESYSVPNQRQQIDVSKGILQDYTDIADLKAIHDYLQDYTTIEAQVWIRKRLWMNFKRWNVISQKLQRNLN